MCFPHLHLHLDISQSCDKWLCCTKNPAVTPKASNAPWPTRENSGSEKIITEVKTTVIVHRHLKEAQKD